MPASTAARVPDRPEAWYPSPAAGSLTYNALPVCEEALMHATVPAPAEERHPAYVYLVSVVAALGGFLFGFDTAVINGALVFLKKQFALSDLQTEAAATSLLFGCIAGAAIAGWLSDRFGRRRILMGAASLFVVSAVGAALPRVLSEFVAARFLGGVAIGVASTLSPIYIAEIAPARARGRLVTLNQMAIVSGILLAFLISWLLVGAGPNNWRWMFLFAALPSVAFLAALFFVPESPRWLVARERGQEAEAVLTRVSDRTEAAAQMRDIRESLAHEEGTLRELFRPGLRLALLVGVVIALASQFSGINTIIYYGSIIFTEHAGRQSASAALFANLVIGGLNFLTTILAIAVIDRVNRRSLLMLVLAGMAVSLAAVAVAFRVQPASAGWILAPILSFIFFFALGMGPGTWLVLSEIYPTRVRGRGMSIGTMAVWVGCAVVTFTFLSLVSWLTPSGAFSLYAFFCAATLVFVWKVVPETRGKTLEEIERLWAARK